MRASLAITWVAATLVGALRIPVSEVSDDAKPVLYSVMMGCLAERNQVRLLVGTAREVGGYDGTIVLVTDRPECLANTLGEKLLGGPKLSSTAAADVYPGAAGGKLYIVKAPSTSDVRKMKAQKTMAFENIEAAKIEHPVSSVLYMDEDIVTGEKLDKFRAFAREKEQDPKSFLAVFNDQGHSTGELHTGVILMLPRPQLHQCMAEWKQKILNSKGANGNVTEAKDTMCDRSEQFSTAGSPEAESLIEMSSLAQTAAKGVDQIALAGTPECHGLSIIPPNFLSMPTEESLQQKQTAAFVHFTNTWRAGKISVASKKAYFMQIGTTVQPFGNTQCSAV